jgi:hypothetical protein
MGATKGEDEVPGLRHISERSVQDPLQRSIYIYEIAEGEIVG